MMSFCFGLKRRIVVLFVLVQLDAVREDWCQTNHVPPRKDIDHAMHCHLHMYECELESWDLITRPP